MDQPTVNRSKLKDVVLYIIERCGAENLGNVKLHKLLYFADMLFYVQTGAPLTGEEYLKQRRGPTARHLTWALKDLEQDGAIKISEVPYYGFKKKHYELVHTVDRRRFNDPAELAILDAVIAEFGGHTAAELSEISHAVPWRVVRMGEPIPYHTAFSLVDAEVSDEAVDWGMKEAARVAAE
jgi:uncharacterized phage-associated protein